MPEYRHTPSCLTGSGTCLRQAGENKEQRTMSETKSAAFEEFEQRQTEYTAALDSWERAQLRYGECLLAAGGDASKLPAEVVRAKAAAYETMTKAERKQRAAKRGVSRELSEQLSAAVTAIQHREQAAGKVIDYGAALAIAKVEVALLYKSYSESLGL